MPSIGVGAAGPMGSVTAALLELPGPVQTLVTPGLVDADVGRIADIRAALAQCMTVCDTVVQHTPAVASRLRQAWVGPSGQTAAHGIGQVGDHAGPVGEYLGSLVDQAISFVDIATVQNVSALTAGFIFVLTTICQPATLGTGEIAAVEALRAALAKAVADGVEQAAADGAARSAFRSAVVWGKELFTPATVREGVNPLVRAWVSVEKPAMALQGGIGSVAGQLAAGHGVNWGQVGAATAGSAVAFAGGDLAMRGVGQRLDAALGQVQAGVQSAVDGGVLWARSVFGVDLSGRDVEGSWLAGRLSTSARRRAGSWIDRLAAGTSAGARVARRGVTPLLSGGVGGLGGAVAAGAVTVAEDLRQHHGLTMALVVHDVFGPSLTTSVAAGIEGAMFQAAHAMRRDGGPAAAVAALERLPAEFDGRIPVQLAVADEYRSRGVIVDWEEHGDGRAPGFAPESLATLPPGLRDHVPQVQYAQGGRAALLTVLRARLVDPARLDAYLTGTDMAAGEPHQVQNAVVDAVLFAMFPPEGLSWPEVRDAVRGRYASNDVAAGSARPVGDRVVARFDRVLAPVFRAAGGADPDRVEGVLNALGRVAARPGAAAAVEFAGVVAGMRAPEEPQRAIVDVDAARQAVRALFAAGSVPDLAAARELAQRLAPATRAGARNRIDAADVASLLVNEGPAREAIAVLRASAPEPGGVHSDGVVDDAANHDDANHDDAVHDDAVDGEPVAETADGAVRFLDGTMRAPVADGTVETLSDGTVRVTRRDGVVVECLSYHNLTDNTLVRLRLPDDSTVEYDHGDAVILRLSDGTTVRYYGRRTAAQAVFPGNLWVEFHPDNVTDDSETVYLADGTTRRVPTEVFEHLPDGRLRVRFPDLPLLGPRAGSIAFDIQRDSDDVAHRLIFPDGATVKPWSANGEPMSLNLPGGATIVSHRDGAIWAHLPDRTMLARLPDDTMLAYRPDGTLSVHPRDGTVRTRHPDGAVRTRLPDSTVIDDTVDNLVRFRDRVTRVPVADGIVEIHSEGHLRMIRRDGVIIGCVTDQADNYAVHATLPDGTTIVVSRDGESRMVLPDSTAIDLTRERNVITSFPDGIEVRHYRGGDIVAYPPGADPSVVGADGSGMPPLPDGGTRRLPVEVFEARPEGGFRVRLPDDPAFGLRAGSTVFDIDGDMRQLTFPDGSILGHSPANDVALSLGVSDNTALVWFRDGTLRMRLPDETLLARLSDGTLLARLADGTSRAHRGDDTADHVAGGAGWGVPGPPAVLPNAYTVETRAGGAMRVSHRNGTAVEYRCADGHPLDAVRVNLPDGTSVEGLGNGRLIVRLPDRTVITRLGGGLVLIELPDGRYVVRDILGGDTVGVRADGGEALDLPEAMIRRHMSDVLESVDDGMRVHLPQDMAGPRGDSIAFEIHFGIRGIMHRLTFPDGTVLVRLDNGAVLVYLLDGTTRVHHVDGSVFVHSPDDSVRLLDGAVVPPTVVGGVIEGTVRFPDGTTGVPLADGMVEVFADCTVRIRYRNGIVFYNRDVNWVRLDDGATARFTSLTAVIDMPGGITITGDRDTTRIRLPDGTVRDGLPSMFESLPSPERTVVRLPDDSALGTRTGRAVFDLSGFRDLGLPDGLRMTAGRLWPDEPHGGTFASTVLFPDDTTLSFRFSDGIPLALTRPDRTAIRLLDDDTIFTRLPDGTRLERFSSGTVFEDAGRGAARLRFADGLVLVYNRDGTVALSDGTVLDQLVDGTVRLPDGTLHPAFPDDSVYAIFPDGTVFARMPGGIVRVRLPNGTLWMILGDNTMWLCRPTVAFERLSDDTLRAHLPNGTVFERGSDRVPAAYQANADAFNLIFDFVFDRRHGTEYQYVHFPEGGVIEHRDGTVRLLLRDGSLRVSRPGGGTVEEEANAFDNVLTNLSDRSAGRLDAFRPGAGFAAIYNPESGQLLARPSGDTELFDGTPLQNLVARRGGHAEVNDLFVELTTTDPTSNVGFFVRLEEDGSLSCGWTSQSVNTDNPSFEGYMVPLALQRPIMRALSELTGRRVVSQPLGLERDP